MSSLGRCLFAYAVTLFFNNHHFSLRVDRQPILQLKRTYAPTIQFLFVFRICISDCYFPFNLIRIKLLPSAQPMKLKQNILAWAHDCTSVFSPLIVLECFYLPLTQLIILRPKNCVQFRKQINRQISIT